jgi:antitoxin VapB
MAISIKDSETERLARLLASKTGETITVATKIALEERLRRVAHIGESDLLERLEAVSLHCASLPMIDRRRPDEVVEYDEDGLPS